MSDRDRGVATPLAYGFAQAFETLTPAWRSFGRHYLLYASAGTFHLDIAGTQWLLPPHRAAWIAADVPLRVRIRAPVTCCSVLYARAALPSPALPCQVFTVTPLAREMFLHAMRWGADRPPEDQQADRFFLALADLCVELAATPDDVWLPRGRSRELERAIEYTLEHLEEPLRFTAVADAAGVSARTLARRFVDEAQMPWRSFLHRARMIAAMELLAEGDLTVTETVFASGFDSVSAFSQAFRRFTGESPSAYRRRLAPR
jgi:AraC-like DNA-binding protein